MIFTKNELGEEVEELKRKFGIALEDIRSRIELAREKERESLQLKNEAAKRFKELQDYHKIIYALYPQHKEIFDNLNCLNMFFNNK